MLSMVDGSPSRPPPNWSGRIGGKMKVELKEGTSTKGNKYYYLEVQITPTYSKRVFLDNAEVELLKLTTMK